MTSLWSFSPAGNKWIYTSDKIENLTAILSPTNSKEVEDYTLTVRYQGAVIPCSRVFGSANEGRDFVGKFLGQVTKKLTINKATILSTLIIGLMAGPAVSL